MRSFSHPFLLSLLLLTAASCSEHSSLRAAVKNAHRSERKEEETSTVYPTARRRLKRGKNKQEKEDGSNSTSTKMEIQLDLPGQETRMSRTSDAPDEPSAPESDSNSNSEEDAAIDSTNSVIGSPSSSTLLERSNELANKINATAISLTACEQIEMTVAFFTSLDFDQEFWNLMNFTTKGKKSSSRSKNKKFGAMWEIYFLQIILTPISITMTFFGSCLLHPTSCLAAAMLGIALVFHLVDFMNRSHSPVLHTISLTIDCQMKLALGLISAIIAAMLASTFLRFGLFSLGAFAAGSICYLVFDAFPFLDPMREDIDYQYQEGTQQVTLHGQMDSELSPFGWIITTLFGVLGGIFLRWYEQASLEIVTAAMGGLGCAYSLHTFVILQGGSINRSIVFLIANFIAFAGWRFQRHRRLYRTEYAHKKGESTALLMDPQAAANWEQLQDSINRALQRPSGTGQPSEKQILELTNSLNTLLTRMEMTETSAAAARKGLTKSMSK